MVLLKYILSIDDDDKYNGDLFGEKTEDLFINKLQEEYSKKDPSYDFKNYEEQDYRVFLNIHYPKEGPIYSEKVYNREEDKNYPNPRQKNQEEFNQQLLAFIDITKQIVLVEKAHKSFLLKFMNRVFNAKKIKLLEVTITYKEFMNRLSSINKLSITLVGDRANYLNPSDDLDLKNIKDLTVKLEVKAKLEKLKMDKFYNRLIKESKFNHHEDKIEIEGIDENDVDSIFTNETSIQKIKLKSIEQDENKLFKFDSFKFRFLEEYEKREK